MILVTKRMDFERGMGYCYSAIIKPHVSLSLALLQGWNRARLDHKMINALYSINVPQGQFIITSAVN